MYTTNWVNNGDKSRGVNAILKAMCNNDANSKLKTCYIFHKNSLTLNNMFMILILFRRILASFRSGAHCLSIAQQQQYQLDEHECLCPYCEVYIENEFHFIFICPLYQCIREKYLQQAMYTTPCIEKLYSLFCSKSITVIRNLACYLHQAFKIRNDFLNIYS